MKICAIVLNYRQTARTEACMGALANQGLDTVLVVDNSEDRRFGDELAAMLERRSGLVDYRLQLINPGSNLGFACGVNLALKDAEVLNCEAFLLINNDAIASPGMVARLAAELADAGRLVVAPAVLDAAGKLRPVLWYQRFFGLLTKRPLPGSFPYLSGCCLLVHRDMLQGGRLFDEDFFMYGEDTLLGWRLVRDGKCPFVLTDVFVRHDGAGSSRRGQLFYEYHMARAHVLLAMKTWRHPWEIPFLLICKSAGLGLRALWRTLRFGNIDPLKGFFLAWRALDMRAP